LRLVFPRWKFDFPHDDIAREPRLGIEHVESVVLILHAQIDEPRLILEEHSFIELVWVQAVSVVQAELVWQKREVVLISRAQHHIVELLAGPVFKMHHIAFEACDERLFFDALGPIDADGFASIAERDRFGAMLKTLNADVLCRIAAADQQKVAIDVGFYAAEIMGMEHVARKGLNAFKIRHVRHRKVTRSHDQIVEYLGVGSVVFKIFKHHRKLLGFFVKIDPSSHGIETNVLTRVALLNPTLNVIEQHFSRRVRGYRPTKMLIKGVVRKLKTFLWTVRPQVSI